MVFSGVYSENPVTDQPSSTKKRLVEALLRVINALIELVAHLAVLAALLAGIWLLENLIHRLWGTDYLFFGKLKLRYIFDGADLAILVGFIGWGIYSVIAAYIKKPKW
jgi:hypothetical protein